MNSESIVAGGMDFRAMLMRKKKPAKKVVVVRNYIQIYSTYFLHVMPKAK